ncbi:type II toxin-antitoxin system RelE/ParE family toxin [Candidatus Methylomirabilis sp.]|uniref:type II toxin-antitoxin system RelE/ParE family toxin n=1 Tax=Candidatus Methylomirabilis sp. TaxID=2032687 RepID=UPI003C76E9E0
MKWEADLHDDFVTEYRDLHTDVQDELLAHIELLEQFGSQLGRPHADTLKGSRHAHMKELQFDAADGVWRVAFAFDPYHKAIVLAAGDKSGVSDKRFSRQLIDEADARFDAHLATVKTQKEKERRSGL